LHESENESWKNTTVYSELRHFIDARFAQPDMLMFLICDMTAFVSFEIVHLVIPVQYVQLTYCVQ